MRNESRGWRISVGAIIVVMIALAALIVGAGAASAQFQGGYQPPSSTPHNQGQGSGVLELPKQPASQRGTEPQTLPRIAPQPGAALTVPSRELRNQSGYEQVTVTVTDQQGRYVTGLQKGDFRLYVDGQQRPIDFFRQDLNTPVSIGIIVDTSGSMYVKIPQAQAAISQFINDLNPADDIFLFAFSSRAYLLQDFTQDHERVRAMLGLLRANGETALFDTTIQGLLKLRHGRFDKKALLVVTDGVDNVSASTEQEVIGQARRRGVLIYSIGIGNPNVGDGGISFQIGPFAVGGDPSEEVDAKTLRELSSETGAKTFIIQRVGDGAALRTACETISRELREQYTVGFLAPDAGRGGYRNLRVDTPGHPEAISRARKGVDVSSAGVESADAGAYGGGVDP
jgi:Ca-activated chloride channel family protein